MEGVGHCYVWLVWVPYFIHFVYICILCTHHDIFVFFTIYFILNIMTHVEVFWFICGGFLELWFSYAQIFKTKHKITLPHGNRSITFYKSIIQAKSLRKVRQVKEMFAVLLHYTPQEIWLFRMWGEFSVKITHFMLMHSKINCRKIQIYHRVYACE